MLSSCEIRKNFVHVKTLSIRGGIYQHTVLYNVQNWLTNNG